MAIRVTKISEALYTATATPPHVYERWSTAEPLRMHQLCEQLLAKRVHQVDVGDAINDADREWLMRGQGKRLQG